MKDFETALSNYVLKEEKVNSLTNTIKGHSILKKKSIPIVNKDLFSDFQHNPQPVSTKSIQAFLRNRGLAQQKKQFEGSTIDIRGKTGGGFSDAGGIVRIADLNLSSVNPTLSPIPM